MAIMAGMAYCVNNLLMRSVPSTKGEFCLLMSQRYAESEKKVTFVFL